MKRGKKSSDAGEPVTNPDTRTGSSEADAVKPSLSSMKSMGLLLAVLMVASVMFSLSVVLRDPPSDDVVESVAASRVLQLRFHQANESDGGLSEKKDHLVPGFDEESCLSRYEASLYRKESPSYKEKKRLLRVSKAVFVSSSSPGYFESIRDVYWENPMVTGEIVSVHKPSYKDYQKTQRNMERRRAWTEIYLLSCSDVLMVTSPWSSLVEVAHGLGGLKPWVLNGTDHDSFCTRARSIEPCSQTPRSLGCKH